MSARNFDPSILDDPRLGNLQRALLCAEASELSYFDEEVIHNESLKKGWEKIRFIANLEYDTQLFIAATKTNIIVCFRGTEDNKTEDWITSFKFMYESVEWGEVHSGFFRAHQVVWDAIKETISTFRNRNQKIILTGHSLGGALAVICSMYLMQSSIEPKNIITFGQPKIGSRVFSNYFDHAIGSRYQRFVNYRDFFTNLPPDDWGYSHCGRPNYFNSRGFLQENPDSGNNTNNLIRRFYFDIPELISRFREYHSIYTYISCLKKNLIRQSLGSYF